MSRHPANSRDPELRSEDPMRDAVALTERIELRAADGSDTIVAGFHRDGRLSLYFGEEPYYQFDPVGRLRRALVEGRLFRTQGSGLAILRRAVGTDASLLLRDDLAPDELQQFLQNMLVQVGQLRDGLVGGTVDVVRQIPIEAAIVERLVESLAVIQSAAGALAPAINRTR